jgi:hypothetical protein
VTTRRYLARLTVGLAILIPLLLWIMARQPLGMWTDAIVPMALPAVGLAVALAKGWQK